MKVRSTHSLLSLCLALFNCTGVFAQTGGEEVFLFMNEAPSARITAMGGDFISVLDDDPTLAFQNPSLLNAGMHNRLSVNFQDNVADITKGYAGFVHASDKLKTTFNAGIQFASYGEFTATDEIGNVTGVFDGDEYAFTIGAGRQYLDRFSYGANITFISSQLETYHSNGAALSLAGAYHDSARGFTATVMFKNVGSQFKTYTSGNREPIPFDLQAGISKRLIHTPFLFSLVLHDLYRWDLRYDDPNATEQNTIVIDSSQQTGDKSYFVDNLFLHTIIGTEIYIGKNVRVSFAYNHQRRQELAVELRKGLSGFSFGAGIRINRFNISYGRAIYNISGGVNHFSLGVNLDELFGKKL